MEKLYLENIRYVYSQGTPFEQVALDDVTLGIRGGCITGIIGHTGSGKSTMMQLLNGLATPTSGKIYLDGYDINSKPEDVYEEWINLPEYQNLSKSAAKKAIKQEVKRRKRSLCFRVGLVMQYPEYQLFEETVSNDIAYGPHNMGLDEDEIARRVKQAAEFTEVDPAWFDKSPFDLSGGQKRRVALAGIIAMQPEVLVLDEPAAGLDPKGRSFIFDGIKRYQRASGSTVIIVSHSMEDMARYCDEVVVMAGARVLYSGDCREVFAHTGELSESGLDIPQITRLLFLLKDMGVPVPQDIYTVDDAVDALEKILKQGGKA